MRNDMDEMEELEEGEEVKRMRKISPNVVMFVVFYAFVFSCLFTLFEYISRNHFGIGKPFGGNDIIGYPITSFIVFCPLNALFLRWGRKYINALRNRRY